MSTRDPLKDKVISKGPRYIEIAEDLHQKIKENIFPAGSMLPKEMDLESHYNVSRITVRKAMQLLSEWDLITRKRGSGTYVKTRHVQHNAFRLKGFVEEISKQGKQPSSKIIAFELIHSDTLISEKLNISKNTQIYRVKRLRLIDGCPEVLEITYMPFQLFPDLSIDVMLNSKYEFIESVKGLKIDRSNQRVRAVLLDKPLVQILEMDSHKPVIRVDSIGFLDDGTIFEYSIHYFKGEHYEFSFSAKRE